MGVGTVPGETHGVRDACRAMSNVKTFNRQLAADRAKGERLDEDFAQLRFRSRKNPYLR